MFCAGKMVEIQIFLMLQTNFLCFVTITLFTIKNNKYMEEDKLVETLENEIRNQQEKLKIAREKLQNKKKVQMEHRKRELQNMLQTTDRTILENREKRIQLREHVAIRKLDKFKIIGQNISYNQEAWNMDRNHQLEEVARQRIEFENIKKSRMALEKVIDAQIIQMDVIQSEKSKRKAFEKNTLSRLLQKGDLLQTQLQDNELESVASKLMNETKQPYRLVDEIQSQRKKKQIVQQNDRSETIRKINRERKRLQQEAVKLQRQKDEYHAIASKGIEYLTEIELGEAPPVDLILKNMDIPNALRDTEIRNEQVLLDASSIENGLNEIDRLKQAYMETQSEYRVLTEVKSGYDGGLDFRSYRKDQKENYYIVHGLVIDFIEKSMDMVDLQKTTEQYTEEEVLWQASKLAMEEEKKMKALTLAGYRLYDKFIIEGIQEIIHDIVQEIQQAKQVALKYFSNALNGAILESDRKSSAGDEGEKGHGFKQDMMQEAFLEIRKARKRLDEHNGLAKVHSMSQTLVQPQLKLIVTTIGKRRQTQQVVNPLDYSIPAEQEVGQCNRDAQVIKIRRVLKNVKSKRKKLAERIQLEQEYWKNIKITPRVLKYPNNIVKCSIVSITEDGKFMAAGGVKGEIYVWDLHRNPPFLLRKMANVPKNARCAITSMEWSWDAASLVVTTSNGEVNVWNVLPTTATWSKKSSKQLHTSSMFPVQGTKFAPHVVYPRMRITTTDLSGPTHDTEEQIKKSKKPVKKQMLQTAIRATFFPAFSMTGQHPCVVIGTQDGIIMKYNSHFDLPGVTLVYGQNVGHFEAPCLEVPLNKQKFKMNSRRIRREFFQAHYSSIIYVGFVDRIALTMITVSKDGLVCKWPYERDAHCGMGWYVPSQKFKLDMRVDSSMLGTTFAAEKESSVIKGIIEQVETSISGQEIWFLIIFSQKIGQGTHVSIVSLNVHVRINYISKNAKL